MEFKVNIVKEVSVIGGAVYQWDSGRKLKIVPKSGDTVDAVHFSNGNVLLPTMSMGAAIVDIPNILLQKDGKVTVYPVMFLADGTRTIFDFTFIVKPKPKPEDYVYTETEVYTIKTAVERALQEAKDSGEFDGENGYTPVRGVDYWTEADKDEIKGYVDATVVDKTEKGITLKDQKTGATYKIYVADGKLTMENVEV